MNEVTATEVLRQAERDVADYVLHTDYARYLVSLAREYFRHERGEPEDKWSPITSQLIRNCIKSAYRGK